MKKQFAIFMICLICINFTSCKTEKGTTDQVSQISISKYMEYQLPDTLVTGEYNQQLGYLGGNVFCLKKTGSYEAMPASDSVSYGWNTYGGVEMYYQLNCTFEDGKLKEVALPWNHSEYLEKEEPLTNSDVSAIIVLVDHDLYTAAENTTIEQRNSKIWYVFFAKEGSDISYAIYLNADLFSKEDMMALAQTVKFKKGAFDVIVQ